MPARSLRSRHSPRRSRRRSSVPCWQPAGCSARSPHAGSAGPRTSMTERRVEDVTTQSGDSAAKVKAATSSPGELASEVAKDMSTLVRQEVALAKAELQQEAKTAGT